MPKQCNYEGCQNNRFGGGFCKFHQWCRTDGKKPKPPKKRSKKKKAEDDEYQILRIDFLNNNPLCQIRKSHECTHMATEVHHTHYRGIYFLAVWTWKATCHNCHEWVHANPKEARKLGFLK